MKQIFISFFSFLALIPFPLAQEELPTEEAPPPQAAGETSSQWQTPPGDEINHWLRYILRGQGYVMGRITEGSDEGFLIRTFEGQLHLSVTSNPARVVNQDCIEQRKQHYNYDILSESRQDQVMNDSILPFCSDQVNPWPISAYDEKIAMAREMIGELVRIRYRQANFYPFVHSSIVIQDILRVDPNYYVQPAFQSNSPPPRPIILETGVHHGRVVQAAFEGLGFFNEYEATIHLGESGGDFVRMTIVDWEMYNYIVKAMATGRLMDIYFYRYSEVPKNIFHLFQGADTGYRIYRVDLLYEDQNEPEALDAPLPMDTQE